MECGKLETIKERAFSYCSSLSSINLPSIEVVEEHAFGGCGALKEAKFGSKLERIEKKAFYCCKSLAQITIPLKDGIITHADIFMECTNLKRVDLVEGALHKTVAALLSEEWKNDMNEEIDLINQILPTASAGYYSAGYDDEEEEDRKGTVDTNLD